jgi:non-homologous end joining protein Ku
VHCCLLSLDLVAFSHLQFSQIRGPIALYPASSLSEKVSFNRISRKTGNRLKQQNIDSETEGNLRGQMRHC